MYSLILLCLIILGVCFIMAAQKQEQKEGFLDYSDKALLIVEPREHKDLQRVIEMFDKNISPDWDLYVFHGAKAKEYAEKATTSVKKNRRVFLFALDSDNLTANEYNKLFKQQTFWDKVHAENILVFQTDTAICGNSGKNLDQFIKYDYIGCNHNKTSVGENDTPWHLFPGTTENTPKKFYGVGGLSFRKKTFMLKCIKDRPDVIDEYPEDVFYSECVDTKGIKPESAKVIGEFCTQKQFYEKSFAAHKTKDLDEKDRNSFYEYCPESSFLKEQFTNMI